VGSIVEDVTASAEWIAQALTSSGYSADFSANSLGEIDRFIDEHAPGGQPRPDGLLGDDLGTRIFSLGAYVGEVVRRNVGATWSGDDSDPEAEINVALHLPDGSVVWPVQRVMKRLQDGPEEGIAAYGAALGVQPGD
jgi:hypothetical protein